MSRRNGLQNPNETHECILFIGRTLEAQNQIKEGQVQIIDASQGIGLDRTFSVEQSSTTRTANPDQDREQTVQSAPHQKLMNPCGALLGLCLVSLYISES